MKKGSEGSKLKYILMAAVIFIGAVTVFGDKGVLDFYNLKKERDGILSYNKSVEKENSILEEKIRLLETDKRYIGQIARKELGKLGKNEVIYKIEDARPEPSSK